MLNGILDDMRIYGRALSAADVQDLYDLGSTTPTPTPTNTTTTTATNTPTPTPTNTPTPTPTNTPTPTATSTSSPGDLLVHWKLNHDGANNEAVDTSGNGNTGLVSGSSLGDRGGKYQGALDFNANSSNYVLDDDGETYLNGLDEITVMMWIKSNSANTDRGFLFGKNPNGSDSGLAMRYDAAGWSGGGTKVIKAAVSTTGGNAVIESVNNVQTTAWQHVAVTWQSGGRPQVVP